MIEIKKPRIECIETPADSSYGKYIIEPLERGYGTTLGNSLRRVLLSSLPGTACTSIRIAGVQHEFSTIPGVKEDVTEIVLNVKSIIARLHSIGPKTVYIEASGEGVVTEVYVNNDAKEVYIVIINEYLAIASKDYDSKKESVDLKVYGIDSKTVGTATEYLKKTDGTTSNDKTFKNVSSDDFALLTEAKEDDAYVVTVAAGKLQTVVKADVVEDTALSSFKVGKKVAADGTTYNYSSAAEYDVDVLDNYTGLSSNGVNLKDKTYNLYLDTHGNLLGIDLVTAADNYVFIAGIDSNNSNLSAKNYDASAIFTDGTMKTITFKADKDGVYTLTEVAAAINTAAKVKVAQEHDDSFAGDIDKKHIALAGDAASGYAGVYGNDDTVYLLASLKAIKANDASHTNTGIISDVDSVTTGVKNASLKGWNATTAATKVSTTSITVNSSNVASGVYTLYKSNGYIIAAVVVGEDNESRLRLQWFREL